MRKAERAGKALLLIHAVSPFSFSYGRRANENNVDINRNFIDFSSVRPANSGYAELHPLMLPEAWPPGGQNRDAIRAYQLERGMQAFRDALSTGQQVHPEGLFYSGLEPEWSNRVLREIVGMNSASRQRAVWLDIHTGLGPYGFGEKILVDMRSNDADADRWADAKRIWGHDVVSLSAGQSVSSNASGAACALLQSEFPSIDSMSLVIEFGTLSMTETLEALRFDHWVYRNRNLPHHDTLAREARMNNARSVLSGVGCLARNDPWADASGHETDVGGIG